MAPTEDKNETENQGDAAAAAAGVLVVSAAAVSAPTNGDGGVGTREGHQPADDATAGHGRSQQNQQQQRSITTELAAAPNPPKQNTPYPAANQESGEPAKKKRGRPTTYSKMGGGGANATAEEIKEAIRTTRLERKRSQEKRRRKDFREALESLLDSLIRQDKDFAKESRVREERMHGHAQFRPISDDNLVFTRVEIVNQSIYTIERLTLEGQELRRTLADLGGEDILRKFGHSNGAESQIFHHGVSPLPSESPATTMQPPLPGMTAPAPNPVDTNDRLQKATQEPFYPSIMFQQQQQQQQQQLLLQQQQQQATLMRGALVGATMPPRPTTGFGIATADPAMAPHPDMPNLLLGGRSTHMKNAAAMLMWQQEQELMLNEQRKALLLDQHQRQNPQVSIGDLQSFLSSELNNPNVPNAEGLLPDYNASSFMSALAAGNSSTQKGKQPANQPDSMSVDVLVQPPVGDGDENINDGTTTMQDPEANPANGGFTNDGFLARLQAGGAFPSMNMNGWQNGQPGNGTRET